MRKLRLKSKNGQMMIEILLALSIVVLVLVALMSAAVVSLRNTRFAKNIVLANHYSQGAVETMRKLRDQGDWVTFAAFNGNLGFEKGADEPSGSCPSDPNVDGLFIRCVNFDNSEDDKTIITVTVEWIDGDKTHLSQASTVLTKWSGGIVVPATETGIALNQGDDDYEIDCNQACIDKYGAGASCLSVGFDDNASNGRYYWDTGYACGQTPATCDTVMGNSSGASCWEHYTDWTNCLCSY